MRRYVGGEDIVINEVVGEAFLEHAKGAHARRHNIVLSHEFELAIKEVYKQNLKEKETER